MLRNAREYPRALIGMLHTGEPSMPAAIRSVEEQQDVDTTLDLIGPLPKWEAHRKLFERFSADGGAHELLVKLDADMELLEPQLLSAAALLMRRHRRLDHIVLGVDDWLSRERIMGLSIWRGGVTWAEPPPDLFTDLAHTDVRDRLKLIDAGRPLVAHARQPSEMQSIRYGAHRATKAMRTRKRTRLQRLRAFAHVVTEDPAPERRLALAAIEAALTDEALGRSLVDGDRPTPDAVLAALQERAAQLDALAGSVLALIDDVEASGEEIHERSMTGQRLVGRPHLSRLRAIGQRLTVRTPFDPGQARAEFLAHLDG